jgi:hypothetical protein
MILHRRRARCAGAVSSRHAPNLGAGKKIRADSKGRRIGAR